MITEIDHGDYTSSFTYKGRVFIVDKFDDFWLITESQFIIKERGKTLEEATLKIKNKWDEINQNINKHNN